MTVFLERADRGGAGANRTLYIYCYLPPVEDLVATPELSYRNCDRPIVVFYEVHQLRDPSCLLKIGADKKSIINFWGINILQPESSD